MALKPFISVPRDLREWTRWIKEALVDGSVTTSQIEDAAVTLAKMAALTARSVIGNATAATATPTAITAAADDRLLARTGGTLAFQQLTAGMFPNAVVPDAALQSDVAIFSSGTYTGTLTGCATAPTLTVSYAKCGNLVIVRYSQTTAVSNSVSLTITGPAPAAIRPTNTQVAVARIMDNSVAAFGVQSMDSSGLLTFGVGASGGFTNVNNKGVMDGTFAYPLL